MQKFCFAVARSREKKGEKKLTVNTVYVHPITIGIPDEGAYL